MDSSAENKIELNLQIPFPNARNAQIAYDVLRIDKEPKRTNVSKFLSLDDKVLKVKFETPVAKNLRVAVNGFFESLILCCETLEEFGPALSEQYSHY